MALCGILAAAKGEPLVSKAGDRAIIPGWHLQSATRVKDDMSELSLPGFNTTHWYRVESRGTVMAGLIENGIYNDTHLFFSDNMGNIGDKEIFRAPWLYREEFTMNPLDGQYFNLITHGITSKADIYVNGERIASKEEQQGSFGGHTYNLTSQVQSGNNCILIRVYPTNYDRDFAQSFEDWNPHPRIMEQGSGAMLNWFPKLDDKEQVNVTLKTNLVNRAPRPIRVTLNGTIEPPNHDEPTRFIRDFHLMPGEERTASVRVGINNPEIWWPASWGPQSLYSVHATIFYDDSGETSDVSRTQQFGIRSASSYVNVHNDTAFTVNGYPFKVMGAGYGPDIFLRYDENRVRTILQYMLDMGLNTIPGWECCTKWEGWKHNEDGHGYLWQESDYSVARDSMLHEAEMMQPHPSMLGFLVGSDSWPNDRATEVYLKALKEMDWRNPIIASASKRGYPEALGPSGMKMDGPYDWVPPNYWYGDDKGAAFGFGSELGAGVGTPVMESLKRFMADDDLKTLWSKPEEGLYHMSSKESSFNTRSIYNKGLFSRYGKPINLEDYVLKCQMADYEATRAQFEAYSAHQNASRTATGLVYWMLNSAWPNLHWQLFDYYLSPMGSYFGTKVGSRMEHVAYDYGNEDIWLINHSIDSKGDRQVSVDLIDMNGKKVSSSRIKTQTSPTSSKQLQSVSGLEKIKDPAFLRLILEDGKGKHVISRNVYWLSSKPDILDWSNSTWYSTPVTEYADYTKMHSLKSASVKVKITSSNSKTQDGWTSRNIELENKSPVPAVFVNLNAIDSQGNVIAPVYWSDNYITLWPHEKINLSVQFEGNLTSWSVNILGRNVKKQSVKGG
ncbi:Exo-beta-D-glucosaminidase [Penicillium citrinum]|uniref:Exo-beta-D-glucosaminidase n=1 Tax=Penicillium citrinum TaxID=5077 RepID=A0A9W9PCC4_PENCI|nr:Exo-beta-D-glucosaminidase [Penicillium citrinum]KAJ5241801.1 Exo-beta-D-glucosaminidase [Penicillium citrinum]